MPGHMSGGVTRSCDAGRKLLLNCLLAGPFAWFGGESGQVGNEAATVAQKQCRSQARLFNRRIRYTFRLSFKSFRLTFPE